MLLTHRHTNFGKNITSLAEVNYYRSDSGTAGSRTLDFVVIGSDMLMLATRLSSQTVECSLSF